MAVVLLASNGDGLGHLVRVTMVAGALASVGERPVIFSQGIYPLESGTEIPGKCIPSLRKADGWMRRAIAAEVRSMAEISFQSSPFPALWLLTQQWKELSAVISRRAEAMGLAASMVKERRK